METKRKKLTTTVKEDLIKKIKILAVNNDVNVNILLEEAIQDLLKKYDRKSKE